MRNKKHLHNGSLISLKVIQQPLSQGCKEIYLASNGFAQSSVIAQNYGNKEDNMNTDFMDSVFMVIPLYEYEAQ